MKKLSPYAAGLVALLTACQSATTVPTPTPNHTLTVALAGVTEAPVTITDANGVQIFKGTATNGKTFAQIKAGTVLTVKPEAMNTYVTPASQTVTLSADQTVTLKYEKAPLHTYYNASGIWDFTATPDDNAIVVQRPTFELSQDINGNLSGYFYDSAAGKPVVDPEASIGGNVNTGTLKSPANPQPGSIVSPMEFTGSFNGNSYSGTFIYFHISATTGARTVLAKGTVVGTRR